ncbi:3-hydroxyanthranilate 3,4-dioxygenase [Saccharomycopsis crataegensis]|uniref:3-hydroxyanthranilate 3,4-dioxygenase n=1 Tax=Saccharomycopsis crataegensis TaxID=43959 RepID=A0AAV5QPB3_9ASCO|nr:3-hydroxyanthranilate 3,4-dioxygenase [Saccharomycopsis crataegensis]
MIGAPINIHKWVKENEHLLQPPVNNFCLHRGGFTVMIVGGPNERTDFHVNQTPEWFYMYKGHMCLRVVENDPGYLQSKMIDITEVENPEIPVFRDVIIEEGDSFLLPARVPHNPIRFSNTIGIVLEQDRPDSMDDQIRWYCSNCKKVIHNKVFHLTDLGKDIKSGILEFDNDKQKRTCSACGTSNYSKPQN